MLPTLQPQTFTVEACLARDRAHLKVCVRLQALHNLLGIGQLGLVSGVNYQYDTLRGTEPVCPGQELSMCCPVHGPKVNHQKPGLQGTVSVCSRQQLSRCCPV